MCFPKCTRVFFSMTGSKNPRQTLSRALSNPMTYSHASTCTGVQPDISRFRVAWHKNTPNILPLETPNLKGISLLVNGIKVAEVYFILADFVVVLSKPHF
ncbi:hypothetical protein MXB_3887 [Myxobolus squamalis]|nr:hypothetical protein MXB_3887 [Myxobolus squamalis]